MFSPTSSLNNKKIASQDDLGSDINVGVVPENTPSNLPVTSISQATRGVPTSVNTIPSGAREDSSSGSSGFDSLPKKKHIDGLSMDQTTLISSNITDSGSSESSEPMNLAMSDSITSGNSYLTLQQIHNGGTQTQQSNLPAHAIANNSNNCVEQGHSRNSSNTSQVSTHSTHTFFSRLQ